MSVIYSTIRSTDIYKVTPLKKILMEGTTLVPGETYYCFGVDRSMRYDNDYRVTILDVENIKCHFFKQKYAKTYFDYIGSEPINEVEKNKVLKYMKKYFEQGDNI